MEPLVAILIGGGVLGIGMVYDRYTKKKRRLVWGVVAEKLGFEFASGDGPSYEMDMWGAIRGVRVKIDVERTGSGDSTRYYTRYCLTYPAAFADSFSLQKRTLKASIISSFFHTGDVSIGDRDFDSRVLVEANDPETLSHYLTPARRIAALTLCETWTRVEIEPSTFTVHQLGVCVDPREITSTVTRLVDIARILSNPNEVDLALNKQQDGDLHDAVDHLHRINSVSGDQANSFTQFLEAEALVASGDGEKAENIFDSMPVFDPVLNEWRNVAASHPQPVEAVPASPTAAAPSKTEPPTTAPPTPAPGEFMAGGFDEPDSRLEQVAVVEDLFGAERLSYEIERRFFQAFENSIVHWSGTVVQSRGFRSDGDFAGAGVKATVLIGVRGTSRLSRDKVHAIVHLPEGTILAQGEEVSFRGQFIHVDGFMRNLYVANAVVR